MSAPGCPREWRGPRWILRKVRPGAAAQEEFDHGGLTELGCPAQWRRTDVFVARVQICAVVEEDRGLLHVASPRELVQRRDAQPVRVVRVCTVREEEFAQFACFGVAGDAPGEIRLVMKYQANE